MAAAKGPILCDSTTGAPNFQAERKRNYKEPNQAGQFASCSSSISVSLIRQTMFRVLARANG